MNKKRIMVVDDDEKNLKLLKINLELTGEYDVLTLPSAKDLLVHVQEFKPDVILLDLIMPATGGLEICEMLNDDPKGCGIPIVILSALAKTVDKVKAYKLGVVDYLVKPVSKNIIFDAIEKALMHKEKK